MVLFLPFSGHTLTSQTTRNAIQGSAPYLTFDGGRTRAINTDSLLGITLSNGTKYTPSTNNSSTTPIQLPVTGQSFADIGMLVPTNTNSVALSTLIGSPYNYWGDDDGDTNVTATGTLSLSIVDKNNETVSRNTVLTICKAPYQVKLTSTNGTLTTRYGVPRSRNFNASNATYYINPKASAVVCFARPNMNYSTGQYAGPAEIWDSRNGFLTQSTRSSSYYQNFPTAGAHGLYFDLNIGGNNQTLSWAPVSNGGITATMSYSTATSVRVTLTGPAATQSQQSSSNPGRISKPILPRGFELVGRDSRGNAVVKYGFQLKQWFVHRSSKSDVYSPTLSWCNSIGYRVPRVRDLTNAVRSYADGYEEVISGATPSSPGNYYQRRIGAGFFTEWGDMERYPGSGFRGNSYWTSDPSSFIGYQFQVDLNVGGVTFARPVNVGLCVSP